MIRIEYINPKSDTPNSVIEYNVDYSDFLLLERLAWRLAEKDTDESREQP